MIETARTENRVMTAEMCRVNTPIQAPVCSTTEARFLQYLIKCIGRNTQPKKSTIELLPFDFGPAVMVEAIQKDYFTDSFLALRRFRTNMIATFANTTGSKLFIEAIEEHIKNAKFQDLLLGCLTPDGHRTGIFFETEKALLILLTELDLVNPE